MYVIWKPNFIYYGNMDTRHYLNTYLYPCFLLMPNIILTWKGMPKTPMMISASAKFAMK